VGLGRQTFTTVAGQATRTIGPTGQFVATARPVRISGAYCTVSGVDYPINIIGQAQYNGDHAQDPAAADHRAAAVHQRLPERPGHAVADALGRRAARAQHRSGDDGDRDSTATVLTYPPGYLNYMKHALGLMLAPDYGVTPSQIVVDIARALEGCDQARQQAEGDREVRQHALRWLPRPSWQNYP
jgi:hypothetical protein